MKFPTLLLPLIALSAGLLYAAEPATSTSTAPSASPTTSPATAPAAVHIALRISTSPDNKAATFTVDGVETSSAKLRNALRQLAGTAPASSQSSETETSPTSKSPPRNVVCDIWAPADLPYEHLATALIACAIADIPALHITTDDKVFLDLTMPRVAKERPDRNIIRMMLVMRVTDGQLTVTFGDKLSPSTPQELDGMLNKVNLQDIQLIIRPDAATRVQDVMDYAIVANAKTHIAFSPPPQESLASPRATSPPMKHRNPLLRQHLQTPG